MLKSPLPRRARRIAGLAVVATAAAAAAVAAWAAQPGLEPDAAQALARPGQEVECKPDANRELHDCQVVATPWARIATAADVAAAFPKYELARGLTADVFLQCAPAGDRLAGCRAKKVYPDQPLPAGSEAAFEAAAVQVAGLYRIKPAAKLPNPAFMTIQFRAAPAMPGGPATGPLPKRAPDALPMPPSKAERRADSLADIPADAPISITRPVWIEKPSAADLVKLYPAEAAARGVSAMVLLTCRVGGDGRLSACAVTRSEAQGPGGRAPEADMDFGTASLQLAKLFRMEVVSQPPNPIVRIPVKWVPHAVTPPGAQAAAPKPVIGKPEWLERPTGAQIAALFPKEVIAAFPNPEVHTAMTCGVARDGRLQDCDVDQIVFQSDKVFAAKVGGTDQAMRRAMLQLAAYFRMKPPTVGGDALVRIPIIWRAPAAG